MLQQRLVNPVVRLAWRARLPIPGDALLETTGRRTGRPRYTPVCDGLDGDVFWLVSQRGRAADWVRNLVADARVRVKVCAARPGGPAPRVSSTLTTRTSACGRSGGTVSRAGSACAPPRRATPTR